jgi:hypothetical protein
MSAPTKALLPVPTGNSDRRAPRSSDRAHTTATARTLPAALAEPGRPLPAATRAYFEPRFGRSLADVRVHTDTTAVAATAAAAAEAMTVGHHVFFAPGRYEPTRPDGLELLAHELAHTIQQHGAHPRPQFQLRTTTPGDVWERQADTAARLAMTGPAGAAGAAITARVGAPMLARRQVEWTPIPTGPIPVDGQPEDVTWWELDKSNAAARFKVPRLTLTADKGPVLEHYQRAVAGSGDGKDPASALESTVEFNGTAPARAGLWEARNRTPELKDRWLAKVSWPKEEANARWHEAGGRKDSFTKQPATATGSCDMDHIIELQLGGSNAPSNIAPLKSTENQASGRALWQQASGIARQLRTAVPQQAGRVNVILAFQSVDQVPPVPINTSPCAGPGAAGCTCSDVDKCAMQKKAAATAAGGDAQPYKVTTGAQTAEFKVPAGTASVDLHEDAVNKVNSELIPCMILQFLERGKNDHSIEGWVESKDHPKRSSRTRLPLALDKGGEEVKLKSVLDGDVYRLKLDGGTKRVKFTYPYLSPGYLDLRITDNGLEGTGRLNVTNPLFRGLRIDVYLRNGEFGGTVDLDPKQLKPPIKGLKITKAQGNVQLAPDLSISGDLGFELGKLVTGSLHAEPVLDLDNPGVYFRGDIKANIPKLEKSEGTIEYRNGAWSGKIEIDSGQLASLPGSPQGNITILITEQGGVEPSGTVTVSLPRGGGITCEVSAGGQHGIIFTGETAVDLPGVKRTKLTVRYDGEHFSGKAKAGVDIKNVTGDIEVKYWDGAYSGNAQVGFAAGRFTGRVTVNLNPRGEIFGEGSLRAPITDTVAATLTVTKPEDGDWRVKGEIELPPKIKLFDPVQRRDEVFHQSFTVNVWGPVVLRFSAALGYDVGVGPGLIENAKVSAEFNPFAETSDFALDASAVLNIPGWAMLNGSLYCGAGVGVGRFGSLTVNIGVDVEGGLKGGVRSDFTLHYAQNAFTVASPITIYGGILFEAQAKGKLVAELLTAEVWSASWDIGQKRTWDPGLSMSLTFPLSYSSDKGFTFPSFSSIERKGPDIDVGALASSLKDKLVEWA